MADDSDELEVTIDDNTWHVASEYAEYDAIHTVAGALLAGAETVEVERNPSPEVSVSLEGVSIGHDTSGSGWGIEQYESVFGFTLDPRRLTRRTFPNDLLDVAGVTGATVIGLYDAGYRTQADLKAASQSDLASVGEISNALAARIKADVGGLDGGDA